ncbi:hypothetical protein [Microbacterium sp. CJ88]|uniref:hypothetical protein n=1 Tax=Microbacterium sp. CJ88 TaxID=3445672 RepID=UPI003F65D7BE
MRSRLAAAALVAVLAAGALSGCVGQPAPVETTPGFATEEESFAAAEQTYRNYVDALNQVDLSDPKTFEPVYMWTINDANAADRKLFSSMHADGLTVSGTTRSTLVAPSTPTGDRNTIELAICQDVSNVTLTRPDGSSAVDPNREGIQSRLVTLAGSSSSSTGWLISEFTARSGAPTCGT